MKFKKEKYIEQRQTKTAGWSFRVRIGDVKKTFNEVDYSTPQIAFQKAKSFRDQVLYEQSHGSFILDDSITLEEALEGSYEIESVAFETRRKHMSFFNRYIGNGGMLLKNVTRAYMMANLNSLVSVLTDDGLMRVLAVWKRIYRYALLADKVQRDLTIGLKPPKSRVVKKAKNKPMTDMETFGKVLDSIDRHISTEYDREIIKIMLIVLYKTGMRPAELFGLHKSDYRKGWLSITKQIGSNADENYVVTIPKTEDAVRQIPLDDEADELVRRAIKMSDSPLLFPRSDGTPWNSRLFDGRIHHATRSDGIEFNPYQLRHLFATEMELVGVDRRTQQELLGHSSYSTTLLYQRSTEQRKKDAMVRRKKKATQDE